jgi:molybdate transport system substrate-binding protein
VDLLAQLGQALSYPRKMILFFQRLCLICILVSTAGAAHARDVVVFAAASLKNVLDEVLMMYEAQSGTSVAVSYAGSSALARQIQQGAPADIFVSANAEWMDLLEDQGLVIPETRRVVAGNRLILIGSDHHEFDWSVDAFKSILGPQGRMAMAFVDAVPAGLYGKAALEALDLWSDLAPSVAQTDNVRAAYRLVSLGEAQLGIVYATDARLDASVHVLATFDEATHPSITYPAARVSDSTHSSATAVLEFLSSADAQASFAAHGFLPGTGE